MTTAATASTRTPVPLLEVAFSSAHKVDRDAGVIRSVKILGRQSRNGRTYSNAALDQAARLYEGLGVNIDHPEKSPGERKFVDGFGYLRNVRRQDDDIFGDLVFLKSHVLAEQVCEAAERMPDQFGLSHHAEGYVATDQGKTIVEGFDRIFSVDIVRNPATSRGLFEQCDDDAQETNETDADAAGSDGRRETTIAELRAQIKRLEAERDARQLLESAGIAADDAKVRAIAALGTEAERRQLLATWPGPRGTRPRSTGSLFESRTSATLPTDGQSFARAIS